jgi:TRAP-type C4-dicarboxylate transport system permease small subunit
VSVHAELDLTKPADTASAGVLGCLQSVVTGINAILVALSAAAIAAAGGVLTWEVAGRYFFKIPSDWQDELSVFLLVGASFCSAGWVQARRGHVGIEALAHILPSGVDHVRRILVDVVSLAFCGFFCWKCWALLREAWEDGQISQSAWGPPLFIPYGLMSIGMSVLVAQLLLQVLNRFAAPGSR